MLKQLTITSTIAKPSSTIKIPKNVWEMILNFKSFEPINLAIVGSRDFTDFNRLDNDVNNALFEWSCINHKYVNSIISGGAKGADTLAERFAKKYNIPLRVHKPDWKKYSKYAGIMRNTDIVNDCNYMVAFPSKRGRGTQDSISKLKKDGSKKLKVIPID